MVAGDDPALTTIAMRLHHSQKITNFAVTKPQNSDYEYRVLFSLSFSSAYFAKRDFNEAFRSC